MDATTSGASSVQYHNISEQTIASLVPPPVTHQRQQRHCFGNATPGEFPLSATHPLFSISLLVAIWTLKILQNLRQATCSFFRQPAHFAPDYELSLAELAALDMCQKRAIFKPR
ncbi:UNVERIFIED_CONTAM: hypothetical protein Sradi_6757100 [Sesamum radiatum]|uniref:Uncharacterized protein n=1 Tax=Sesamum radiatum TaxID=300843 RepID=A0AAW2JQY3_SESRA